jgi:metal-responsive CopG/Arc/MetJ family transcriptional regulator
MNVHVTVSVDPKLLKEFDLWLKLNKFKTRSEAIVYLMRQAMPERKDGDDQC